MSNKKKTSLIGSIDQEKTYLLLNNANSSIEEPLGLNGEQRGHLLVNEGTFDFGTNILQIDVSSGYSEGATNIIDESPNPIPLVNPNVFLNDFVEVVNNSMYFEFNEGLYIDDPDRTRFELADGDWTFEVWGLKPRAPSALNNVSMFTYYNLVSPGYEFRWASTTANTGGYIGFRCASNTAPSPSINDFSFAASPADGIRVGERYDIAVERQDDVVRIYVDGVMVGSANSLPVVRAPEQGGKIAYPSIGKRFWDDSSGTMRDSEMVAMRITKGRALYATDGSYTVPTLPL